LSWAKINPKLDKIKVNKIKVLINSPIDQTFLPEFL